MMATRKTGLHKDVSMIFDGVWNPEVDNIQESFDEPEANFADYVQPRDNGFDNRPKEARFGTMAKVFKAPGYFLSPRRRREKKRLLSISKHLLINIPS
jgi:hypothetical protein